MANIAIIGMGNMGEAILKALLRGGLKAEDISCYEAKADRADFIRETYRVECVAKPDAAAGSADFLVLAVKPQDARKTIESLAHGLSEGTVVVSIMAGITTSNILSMIGVPARIVRIMPNICAKVGEAAMGITANDSATKEDLEALKGIFQPLGAMVEVGEELMDAVTALGGSGPAFFLHFLEGMIDAGVKTGLPRDKSRAISMQVVKGTLRMLEEEKLHPTLLKEMVTSPGGTTIAGLAVLEEGALKGHLITAVESAAKRARELSQ